VTPNPLSFVKGPIYSAGYPCVSAAETGCTNKVGEGAFVEVDAVRHVVMCMPCSRLVHNEEEIKALPLVMSVRFLGPSDLLSEDNSGTMES
jgi:hypothetical protein